MRIASLFILLTLSLLCRAHEGDNYEHSDMLANMKPGDKAALLMVHFGTTHDDTRALTIDAINAKAQATIFKVLPDKWIVAHKGITKSAISSRTPFLRV